ncbi:hypothetical protein P4O66_005766, partial [Electrophorus voltai]
MNELPSTEAFEAVWHKSGLDRWIRNKRGQLHLAPLTEEAVAVYRTCVLQGVMGNLRPG